MVWLLGAAIVGLFVIYLYALYLRGDTPQIVRIVRYGVGGTIMLLAGLLGIAGRIGIASLLGMAGAALLFRGRLGPLDLTSTGPSPGSTSRVRSRFFEMQLDHDDGSIEGRIVSGDFAGHDLWDLDQAETGELLSEVSGDTDSLALLEAWLDANRSGWRDYFGREGEAGTGGGQAGSGGGGGGEASRPMDARQAREILGVSADAGAAEIKAAHRRLLKAVHPDHGGSDFLAARINEAKDFLLKSGNGS